MLAAAAAGCLAVCLRGWLVEGGLSFDGDDLPAARLIPNIRSYLARLFAYTAVLVFGAVTLAWWGF
jgi:hypothetical protein